MASKVGVMWIHMDASWWNAGIQVAKKNWPPAGEIVGPVFVKCGDQLGGPAGGSVPALWRCIHTAGPLRRLPAQHVNKKCVWSSGVAAFRSTGNHRHRLASHGTLQPVDSVYIGGTPPLVGCSPESHGLLYFRLSELKGLMTDSDNTEIPLMATAVRRGT
ncbi:hypothetical protein C8J57DRAFT_1232335 [Mycena rebaudengoi]|nr:hypothetical protein C8J57DRAFT_1232335 [Mycena rebaudengoi]